MNKGRAKILIVKNSLTSLYVKVCMTAWVYDMYCVMYNMYCVRKQCTIQ